MKRRGLLLLNSVIVFAGFMAVWQAVVWLNHMPAYILPGPWTVALALWQRLPSLLHSLLITSVEAAGGLGASIVVGVAVAMMFAQWRWLR
ncbi:MAG TPA: hypothetical protein VMV57_12380 [Terracidiphilus sp.]|nr:hypothetical protein [Terracidiphilus sp.]